eukprot:7143277-Alexandrium_andersonii.AAC.1
MDSSLNSSWPALRRCLARCGSQPDGGAGSQGGCSTPPGRALEPRGAPEPSGGPLGMAGRFREFGRRPTAGHPACSPGRAGSEAQGEGGSGT